MLQEGHFAIRPAAGDFLTGRASRSAKESLGTTPCNRRHVQNFHSINVGAENILTPPGHAPRSSSSPPSFLDAPPVALAASVAAGRHFSARFTPSCTRARSAQGLGCVLCLPLSRSLSPARMLRTPCLSPRPVPRQRPRRCVQIDANARAGTAPNPIMVARSEELTTTGRRRR